MKNPSYDFGYSSANLLYWFYSKGKNGDILKMIEMQEMERSSPVARYNLAMYDVIDGQPDLEHVTDNQDHEMLSATIEKVVEDFLLRFPEAEIYVEGDTPTKTRLYRMKISNNLEHIEKQFLIQGRYTLNGDFYLFAKDRNYSGFLISRKRRNLGLYE